MVVLAGLYSRVKVCFLCIPLLLSSLMIPQGWGRDRKWLRTSDLWEMVKTDACLKSLYFCLFGFFFFLVSPWGFPGGSVGKESTCNAGDLGLIPGLGRSSGEGKATHSSILTWTISMDRGVWWATAYRVTKSWTQLRWFNFWNWAFFIFCQFRIIS